MPQDLSFKNMIQPPPAPESVAQQFIPPPDNTKLTPEEVASAQMIYQNIKANPQQQPLADRPSKGWGQV